MERGQREAVDLTRRVATAPRDVAGFFTSAVRTLTDAQGRALDLTRQLLDEVTDSGREGRDTMRKVIEANRQAGQAAIEATRETVTRAGCRRPEGHDRQRQRRPRQRHERRPQGDRSSDRSSSTTS